MGVEKLQATTGGSMTVLNDRKLTNEQLQGHLTNVVAAYEAMKQLRESRGGFWGWLWKIFNGEQNRQEEEYLDQLNTQIDLLKNQGYEIGKVRAGLTRKTVLGNPAKVTAKDKGVVIEPVMKQLNEKRNAVTFKGEYADKCFRAIPQSAQKVFSQTMLRFSMAEHLYNRMRKMN